MQRRWRFLVDGMLVLAILGLLGLTVLPALIGAQDLNRLPPQDRRGRSASPSTRPARPVLPTRGR